MPNTADCAIFNNMVVEDIVKDLEQTIRGKGELMRKALVRKGGKKSE